MKNIKMSCSKCEYFGQRGCEEREYLRREGKDCFKLESKEKTMDIKKELQDLCDRYKAEAEAILAKAEKREYCGYISAGHVVESGWSNILDWKESCAIGNCSFTKEAAEFATKKLKAIAELKRFAEEHNNEIDWKDDTSHKWHSMYDCDEDNFVILNYILYKYLTARFSSEENTKAAIEAIGKERPKKYCFEVKE